MWHIRPGCALQQAHFQGLQFAFSICSLRASYLIRVLALSCIKQDPYIVVVVVVVCIVFNNVAREGISVARILLDVVRIQAGNFLVFQRLKERRVAFLELFFSNSQLLLYEMQYCWADRSAMREAFVNERKFAARQTESTKQIWSKQSNMIRTRVGATYTYRMINSNATQTTRKTNTKEDGVFRTRAANIFSSLKPTVKVTPCAK